MAVDDKNLSRRRFLGKLAGLGGLAIGGAVGLAACGDSPTNTAPSAPTATVALPATATSVVTPANAKTTAPVATTKAPAPTKAPASATTSASNAKTNPDFVAVGLVQDFAGTDTAPKLVTLDSPRLKKQMQVFVVKQGSDYSALSNICTHQGCEVEWITQDSLFECPCHGSQYDLSGDNVGGPAPLPLARYTTKVENGQLLVSIKKGA